MRIKAQQFDSALLVHLVWGPMVVMFVTAAGLFKQFAGLLPKCILHELTGYPCLTCGGTRSVIALSRFDFPASFYNNPLVPVFAIGLILLSLYVLICAILKKSISLHLSDSAKRLMRYSAIAFLVLNWLFLILTER